MDGVLNLADRLEQLPGLLTVAQLAALLGVHPQTLYKEVAASLC